MSISTLSMWLILWIILLLADLEILMVSANQDRWLLFTNNHTYEEYWLYKDKKSWGNSRDACIQEGGHLAVIKDQQTQHGITAALRQIPPNYIAMGKPWIGGRRLPNWSWTLPNVKVNRRDQKYFCGYMKISASGDVTYKADSMCDERKRYICFEEGCEDSQVCQVISVPEDTQTYEYANKSCLDHQMSLTSLPPSSNTQHQVIPDESKHKSATGPGEYWIGLHYEAWEWVTKEPIIFTHTKFTIEKSEEHPKAECLLVWLTGHWFPTSCSEENMYICQKGNKASNEEHKYSPVIAGGEHLAYSTRILVCALIYHMLTVIYQGLAKY